MSTPPIIQKENSILRLIAKDVPISDISSPKIKQILKDMKEALDGEPDGVAIAAPQIGVSLRIFLVSGRALTRALKDENGKIKTYNDMVCINPKITKISKTKKLLEEGCLSVRYAYGKIKRATKATIEAYDEKGTKFTVGGTGLIAQIFQHETDHLNGVLFIDSATEVKEIPPEAIKELKKQIEK